MIFFLLTFLSLSIPPFLLPQRNSIFCYIHPYLPIGMANHLNSKDKSTFVPYSYVSSKSISCTLQYLNSILMPFTVAPKISPFSFGDEPLEANEFVSVTCTIMKGDFPITIDWLFNNRTVMEDEEISISQSGKRMSVLAIESVKGHHAGLYSCIGRNDAGYDIHSSNLLVNGLLDAY